MISYGHDVSGITLANLRVALTPDLDTALSAWPKAYAEFVCRRTDNRHFKDDCEIVTAPSDQRPNIDGLSTLYSSSSWRLARDVNALFYVFERPSRPPYLILKPDAAYRRVTAWLHNGEGRLRDANGKWRVAPIAYPVDQVLMMGLLAHHAGVIVHGCGLYRGGATVLCAGVSGAGKSTLSRQIPEDAGVTVLSDDRIAVRILEDGVHAWGTPWPGEGKIARNLGAPLEALCFIEKASENRLTPLSPREGLRRLLTVASVPWFDPTLRDLALATVERVVTTTPLYRFECRPEPAAAHMLETLLPK